MNEKVWTEEEERELVEALKASGEIEHLPLPKNWYKKHNIPFPKPMNFKEFANSGYWFNRHYDPHVEREVRTEPVPGGVRPVLEIEPVKAETITRTLLENQPETHETTACSTESSDSAPPPLEDLPSSLPSQHDGPNTTLSS